MTTISHTDAGAAAAWLPTTNQVGRIDPITRPGSWAALAVTWHAAINYFVPNGYEDETGFHRGEKPTVNFAGSSGGE